MASRLGGLGQLWRTARRAVSLMFLCQLLSPLVALVAVCLAGTTGLATTPDRMFLSEQTEPPDGVVSASSSPAPALTSPPPAPPRAEPLDSCCGVAGERAACPTDHTPAPYSPACQNVLETNCSALPLACLTCTCQYSCTYGQDSEAECAVHSAVDCAGPRQFNRGYNCRYCFLSPDSQHSCSGGLGCNSAGSPTSKLHWYIANCSTDTNTVCLGKRVFSKRRECNWTEGYSWNTALWLSITLGGFGADRFYLGHWQEGIGKLFSFGGLGVWTLVDVVLVSTGYIGPADGSLYI